MASLEAGKEATEFDGGSPSRRRRQVVDTDGTDIEDGNVVDSLMAATDVEDG